MRRRRKTSSNYWCESFFCFLRIHAVREAEGWLRTAGHRSTYLISLRVGRNEESFSAHITNNNLKVGAVILIRCQGVTRLLEFGVPPQVIRATEARELGVYDIILL